MIIMIAMLKDLESNLTNNEPVILVKKLSLRTAFLPWFIGHIF